MLANPVCFAFDEKGRFYVAETFRLHDGVTDIRGHMDWLDDDLACRTVADRVAMCRSTLGDKFKDYDIEHDRVRLLEDTDGDGKADKATVFADGFHHAADGIGAGVLARKGNVWYTCIPDLWLLADTEGDRQGRRAQSAAPRLRRPRRLPRPRPARPAHRAGRQALFLHRRPRLERQDARRPTLHCRTPAPCCAAIRTAPSWRSSPPACATRRSWPSTNTATCSPATTTPTPATRPAASTSSRRRQRLAHRLPVHDGRGHPRPVERGEDWRPAVGRASRRTSCRRSPTSPTARPA